MARKKIEKPVLNIQKDIYHIVLKTTTDLLGSQPASLNLYKEYLLSKLEKELNKLKKEIERWRKKYGDIDQNHPLVVHFGELLAKKEKIEAGVVDGIENRGLTVFPRDSQAGKYIVIYNYQLLGCLKATMKDFFPRVRGGRNMVTRYMKITPREILLRDWDTNEPIDTVDILERPLQAWTPAGHIVSIVRSERAEPSVRIEFELEVWGAGELNPFEADFVKELLRIAGEMEGVLQWRNGGYGRFELAEFEN
jgi:hypothetical protein